MSGAFFFFFFETVQKVASIEATHCSKQPTICYNSKHSAFDHFISRRGGSSRSKKKKEQKRHVPGREKAEKWLCPTNCGFLWCLQWCLTTLMIHTLCLHFTVPPPNQCKTSAAFSDLFFFPSKQLSSPPPPPPSSPCQLFCLSPITLTRSVSWCLPYSPRMLSRRNGCLMICLHRSCRELFRFELRGEKGEEGNK